MTNPCFCIFGEVFCVLQFFHTHFQALFLFNACDLSLENSVDSYMFSTSFMSLSVLLLFPLSIAFVVRHLFYTISTKIDEVLSINPSANAFVFGNINIDHKDWLTYSGGTNRSGELCYNFSISNDLTQMVNFPTWIPDCDSHFH